MPRTSTTEPRKIDAGHFREAKLAVRAYARDPSSVNEDWVRSAWERVREAENLYWERFREQPVKRVLKRWRRI